MKCHDNRRGVNDGVYTSFPLTTSLHSYTLVNMRIQKVTPNRTKMLMVRFTESEWVKVKQLAELEAISISSMARSLLVKHIRQRLP